jgi:putative membrane protein
MPACAEPLIYALDSEPARVKSLIVHWIVSALLLLAVDYFIDGIAIAGIVPALLAAIVLGALNAVVRPVLILITLPITLLTLGLFLFVINAATFGLAAALVPGFTVSSFGAALVGAFLLTIFNLLASALLHRGPRD